MGEALNTEVVNTKVTEQTTTTTSIEDVAREQGWRPKEEYDGDPAKWVSAETFVAKGELIEKIEALGKELKNQRKTNSMLMEHHKKVQESEFKRAVEYLKAQKKEAYERGDVDKIIELDDQITEVRATQKLQATQVAQEQTDEPHPDFVAWSNNNKWYKNDSELREEADVLGLAYAQRNKDKTPTQVLEYVEKQIKKMYPEKFTNPNRSKPSAVEGSGTPSGSKTEDYPLTEEERRVMNTFIRSNIMTKEEYIRDLKKIKGEK